MKNRLAILAAASLLAAAFVFFCFSRTIVPRPNKPKPCYAGGCVE